MTDLKLIMRISNVITFDKRSTSSMILFLSSAQTISNVLRIISGLLVARFIVPEVLGTYTGLGIILNYLPLLQLGVMNGLNRELPYQFGKGNTDKAKKYASVAQFWELSLSILLFLVLLSAAIYFFFKSNYIYAAGLFTYALASIHHYFGQNYLQVLFVTNNDFNKLSVITLIISLVSLFSVFFVWKWQFYGLCVRGIITVVIESLLLWRWKPLFVYPKWNFTILKEIIKIGLPIYIVGLIFAFWIALQNTLVLKFGGAEQYGFYSLAVMIEASLGVMALSIERVIYPKMSFEYGAGKNIKQLLEISSKPILISLLVLIPSVVVGWILIPYFVEWLTPKYQGGVEAARWTMLLLLISVFGVNNSLFNVLKKQKDLIISLISGIVAFIGTLLFLYNLYGFSLVSFPQSMIVGKSVQLIVGYTFIMKYLRNKRTRIRN